MWYAWLDGDQTPLLPSAPDISFHGFTRPLLTLLSTTHSNVQPAAQLLFLPHSLHLLCFGTSSRTQWANSDTTCAHWPWQAHKDLVGIRAPKHQLPPAPWLVNWALQCTKQSQVPIQQSVKITNKSILQQQSMIIKLLPPTESSTSRNKKCFRGTFALDSPPREGTCQDGKNLDAYQEQDAHQDALSQYQCPMGHRTLGHYVVF